MGGQESTASTVPSLSSAGPRCTINHVGLRGLIDFGNRPASELLLDLLRSGAVRLRCPPDSKDKFLIRKKARKDHQAKSTQSL